jgi:hypothetical protein
MLNSGNLIESRNRNIAATVLSAVAVIVLFSVYFVDRPDAFSQIVGPIGIAAAALNVAISWRRATKADSALIARASVEDRLDELERLKRRDMVTPEEYTAKWQEILKDL